MNKSFQNISVLNLPIFKISVVKILFSETDPVFQVERFAKRFSEKGDRCELRFYAQKFWLNNFLYLVVFGIFFAILFITPKESP